MDSRNAGTAYLAVPDGDSGPGVLVLHSWWGLTGFFKRVCDRLAEAGFVALAPDLFDGATPATPEDAQIVLAERSADEMAHLTSSSMATLRGLQVTPDGPIGVLGFSMGASMALWLSARAGDNVGATTVFYGAQDIDFSGSQSAYLGHFAEVDDFVGEDDLALLEAELHLDGLPVEFHRYPGTRHWFFEDDRPEHDPAAADLAWERTITFFRSRLTP